MALNAMLVAMCTVLAAIALKLGGNLKITFESVPVHIGALLFGPVDGMIIGGLGTFLYQVLFSGYGITATTPLWILPYIVCGLAVGAYAKRRDYSLSRAQLIFIMVYVCITTHRPPRKRELAGVILALAGTYLIATGGNPATLTIPPEGLFIGLVAAVGAACMSVIPVKLLPKYGSSVITGSGMLASGIVSSVFIQPWSNMPAFDAMGWGAFAVLALVGSFLAYFLYMQGVKEIGSMRASLIGTVEPVSATITSALFLGTVFAGTDLLGFALIIVMVFLTV